MFSAGSTFILQKMFNNYSIYVRMTWLGHASVLAEVDGETILTDPIFSYRASAVQVQQLVHEVCTIMFITRLTYV